MMHSTKTLLIAVIVVGAAMFVAGHALWDGKDVDNSEATPTPPIGVSPSQSTQPSHAPMLYTVRLTAGGPVPKIVTIKAGDSVTMVGEDQNGYSPKSKTCAEIDARNTLRPGEVYTLTFDERRTCTYFDSRQPETSGRQGTIIVQ